MFKLYFYYATNIFQLYHKNKKNVCARAFTWSCWVGVEEVSFNRDLGSAIVCAVCFNASVQLRSSASLCQDKGSFTTQVTLTTLCTVGKGQCEKCLKYLDKEKFGFPSQRLTSIPPEERREIPQLHWAVGTKENAFVSMTEQNADKRGGAAVVVFWH